MPRRIQVRRVLGDDEHIVVVLDSIVHTLSKPAFVELMTEGLRVLQSLEPQKGKG